ncbi:hypothetical protein [Lentzea guizhouensis]|uniref:hypothetical protein n=1 Tax=Lentzea guizhouensis TaxID=1586287 RepID=UPI0012B6A0B2|nr:hypothetical protein [Lentzea guizhouensis]
MHADGHIKLRLPAGSVLIGGPDCNKITAEVVVRLESTMQFAILTVTSWALWTTDAASPTTHEVVNHHPTSAQGCRLTEDYGLVIRA